MRQLNAFDFTLGRKLDQSDCNPSKLILREQLDGQLGYIKTRRNRAAGSIQKVYRGHLVRLRNPVRRNSWSGGNTGADYYDYYGEDYTNGFNQGYEEQYWADTPKTADANQYWAYSPATNTSEQYFFEQPAQPAADGAWATDNQVEQPAEEATNQVQEPEAAEADGYQFEELWAEADERHEGDESMPYGEGFADDAYLTVTQELGNVGEAEYASPQEQLEEVPETTEDVVLEAQPETIAEYEEVDHTQAYEATGPGWNTTAVEEEYDELLSKSLHQATEYDDDNGELEEVTKGNTMEYFYSGEAEVHNVDEALPTVPLTDLPADSVEATGWSVKEGPDNGIYLYPEGDSSKYSGTSGTSEEKKAEPLAPVDLAMDALYKSGYLCATKVYDMTPYINQLIKVARSNGSTDDVTLVQVLSEDKLRCKKDGKTFVKKKKFCWLTPPDLLAMARRSSTESAAGSTNAVAPDRRDSWTKQYNEEGEEYFYNVDTGETAWTVPEEEESKLDTAAGEQPRANVQAFTQSTKTEKARRSSKFDTDLFNTDGPLPNTASSKADDLGLELF